MTFDIAARLRDARQAVERTETYVVACHVVGYQQADLTAHAAQVIELFTSEAGLDLTALASDCANLRAAVRAAEGALHLERSGLEMLATAWEGESWEIANEFIERQYRSGEGVVSGLRVGADSCEDLQANLWRIVDAKVNAAVTIDDRSAGRRAEWLAAARSVASGGADRATAVGIVEHEIMPYVDADIRIDWVGAMRSAAADIQAAYTEARNRISVIAATYFEVPGRIVPIVGPEPPKPAQAVSTGLPGPASVSPVATLPSAPSVSEVTPAAAAVEPAPSIPEALPNFGLPSAAAPLGMPGSSAGPDVGNGIASLIGQIVDTVGGLLEPSVQPLQSPGAEELDPAEDESGLSDQDGVGDDGALAADDPSGEMKDIEEESVPAESAIAGGTESEPATDATEETESEAVADVPQEPVVEIPMEPPSQPGAVEHRQQTPCEIAANELPEVGQ